MFRHDVEIAARSDRSARCDLDRRERQLGAGLPGGDRGRRPGLQLIFCRWASGGPSPEFGVQADLGEERDMIDLERFEADEPALQGHRVQAGGYRHRIIVRGRRRRIHAAAVRAGTAASPFRG
jgi:hypothetical protein